MTHHFDKVLEGEEEKEGKDFIAPDEYVADAPDAEQEEEIEPTNLGKEGKKAEKAAKKEKKEKSGAGYVKRSLREAAKCSFCSNPMTMSKNMNWQDPVKGKELSKNTEAKNPGPGGQKKIQGVLCDDCTRLAASGAPVTINTVVVDDGQGNISNPSVTDF